MKWISPIKDAFSHFLFPHVCEGCGTDSIDSHQLLCIQCHSLLPQTFFHLHPHNPVEKLFWGRLPLRQATAQYYYTKESLMQRLLQQVKYKGNKELGIYLGTVMGKSLLESGRFGEAEALVPLPLFPSKEKARGFNQAGVICEGIATVLNIPVFSKAVARNQYTESQTTKNRVERWQNMEGRFEVMDTKGLEGKHVLLVDDVITTGATLEACGRALLQIKNTGLSVATLCFSSGS
jgi:ComF family protein